MRRKGACVFVFIMLATLAACAPLSQDIRRQAEKSAPFAEIQKNPDSFVGTIVIWGGVIIETTNLKESTAIKVLQTALDIQERPMETDRSEGRFIVVVDRFLDPDIFKKGRQVTVGGEIAGKEIQPIGEIQYGYPVVRARELKLWEQPVPYPPYYYDPWYWGPYPWRSWGPWGRPYGW
ncbi:MAG TPA: Slp family lipoprotein [Syntrophales bacterium]|nr:Slp family lipoprotein [Syntrophales bacterium]